MWCSNGTSAGTLWLAAAAHFHFGKSFPFGLIGIVTPWHQLR